MSLLEIKELSFAYADKILYKNADFKLNRGEHVGVVGQNGTGKSTLIGICTSEIIPDSGIVHWHPGVRIGFLDQYAKIEKTQTVETFLKMAYSDLFLLEEKINEIYEKIAQGDTTLLDKAARMQSRLEDSGFYSIQVRLQKVANGLSLPSIGMNKKISELSGGQRAKVILAKILLEDTDVLLLDEPTNFLDKEHVEWLWGYLALSKQAFMVVSHDVLFLEKISTYICDIDCQTIKKYSGGFHAYQKQKEQQRKDYITRYHAQQRQIEKTEEFIRKNIAGNNSKNAKGRRKQLDRMERLAPIDPIKQAPEFLFQELPIQNVLCLKLSQLSVGYYVPLFTKLNLLVQGGQKLAVTGFNGIGKSTLLKTLVCEIPALSGDFSFSDLVTVGYYSQDFLWKNGEESPFQVVSNYYPSKNKKDIMQILFRSGITKDQVTQPVKTLSGGEQAKVKLCLLMQKPCNFLILDEPTNHLDHTAKEKLKEALVRFEGTILLVSHEEAFYREIVQKVINIEELR